MKRVGELTDLSEAPPSKRVKVDPAELLNVIFRFKHKPPSNRQDEPLCKTLVKEFQSFVETLNPEAIPSHCCGHVNPLVDDRVVPVSVFAAHEVDQLQEVCRRLEASDDEAHSRGDVWIDPWLPMYGCALQRTRTSAALVKLEVVFVDGWERTLHFLPTGKCVHSAVPTKHHVLHCADLDAALEGKFGTEFASKLQKAQEGKGSKRSAASNSLGHQKTPQFIAAVVRRAVASVTRTTEEEELDEGNALFSPYGGTTDVGMHTGGKPRDTCWPLVQAVVEHNLCCGRKLFQKATLMFQLSLLQQSVHEAASTFQHEVNVRTGCDVVDDMFFMLQVVVQSLVGFLEDGYDVSALQEQSTALRSSLDGFVDALNHQTAARYRLPESVALQQLNALACGVQVASPQRDLDSNAEESDEVRRLRALAALEGCWLVDGVVCSQNALLQWGKATAAPKAYMQLRTIETFMFVRSLKLKEDGAFEHPDVDDELYVERMKSLVTTYQKVVGDWRQLPRTSSVLDVEQRSRELLVSWIAFCLVHQRCVELVPLCADYAIALNWRDLKVAVLSDRAATTALQNTAQYIRAWNEKTKGLPLFHLTDQDPTFAFARKFGLSSDDMIGVYNREVEIWERHVQTQWRAIETKKARANELRAEILCLDEEMEETNRELADENARLSAVYPPKQYTQSFRESGAKAQFLADINRIKNERKRLKTSLKTALATPAALVRPLPVLKEDAIQVIFMLTMPRDVEALGSLCLTAQRALAPEEATTEMKVCRGASSTTWQAFYANAAPTETFRTTTTEFTAVTSSTYFPGCYVPQTIDSLASIAEFKSNCVASPILRGTTLTWQDSTGKVVNPFKADSKRVLESFIEKMPGSFEQFQWMNTWPGGDATRGNMVYARLSEQPDAFDKASFIALGSLRAYPNQQYRKLQCALLDDAFPWSHTGVETLVRQSLYQVGDLTDEEEPKFLWKTDLFHTESGIATFCWTLQRLAEKLEQTPRCFENVPLLSELAGYASQFTDAARPIVKLFARMARRWAEDSRSDEGEASPERITAVRRKRCILNGYALLAYKLGPLDDEAAKEVCELVVLFRTSFLCASIKRSPH